VDLWGRSCTPWCPAPRLACSDGLWSTHVDSVGSMACLFASDAFAIRTSSLIATLNPMTETTNPARLIQSPTLMVIGSSALIIDRGRAMFTLFLGATTF
jgi:hypothetical protein